MRAFALVVIAGCGGSSSHTETLQGWQHSYSLVHERHQKACEGGDAPQCYLYGAELLNVRVEFQDDHHPDWQFPWPIDRAGAKTALVTSCAADAYHKFRFDACQLLIDQKLVTTEEGFAMCTGDKPVFPMCGTIAKSGSFDEHQWYQLCSHTAFLCEKALPHLTDPADKAFADMGTKFETVSIKITGFAAHYGVSDDGDDDDDDDSGGGGGGASASSDSSCHKDTDCKGDRICQAGSCVDAGTKPAKPASLGVAECDQLAQMIETKVFSCSNLSDQPLRDAYQAYKDAWNKVDAERRKAMAPVCKEEMGRVETNLSHVHCT